MTKLRPTGRGAERTHVHQGEGKREVNGWRERVWEGERGEPRCEGQGRGRENSRAPRRREEKGDRRRERVWEGKLVRA